MPSDPIRPAITKEEWTRHPSHQVDIAVGLVWASLTHADSIEAQRAGTGEVKANGEPSPHLLIAWNSANESAIVGRRHALAALALYGQPFGFDANDVRELRIHLDQLEMAGWPTTDGVMRHREWLRGFVQKIEALLPPSESPSLTPVPREVVGPSGARYMAIGHIVHRRTQDGKLWNAIGDIPVEDAAVVAALMESK